MKIALGILLLFAGAGQKAPRTSKEAIKKIQWLVGEWKTTVQPEEGGVWIETQAWEFKFNKQEWALQFVVKEGKLFRDGLLRYDPRKKVYRLVQTQTDGKKATFEGRLADNELTLDEVVAEGAAQRRVHWMFLRDNRYIGAMERRRAGAKSFIETHAYQFTKQGVPFVRNERPKCIVTGGAGTIEVAYQGKKYLVCCNSCRKEFLREPAKTLAEAKKEGYLK